MNDIHLTVGHIARHTPRGAGAQGRDAAIVDIAQDLLLRHLHGTGVLDALAFKGGTSLRKLYAGNAGRFSLDLDFATVSIGADPEDALTALIAAIDGLTIGPFRYGVTERRGKWTLTYDHDYGGAGGLASKLDLNPPPWLPPLRRGWQPLPVHAQYGQLALPELQIVRIEENLAEKIARLNRTTPARDMYDLRWVMTNTHITGQLDLALLRRLAVLKIWVDANGLHAGSTFWKPGHEGPAFDPARWLRDRSIDEFDEEDIGALAVPVPSAAELSDALRIHFRFLADLDDAERTIALAREQDRPLALRLLAELPGDRLADVGLYRTTRSGRLAAGAAESVPRSGDGDGVLRNRSRRRCRQSWGFTRRGGASGEREGCQRRDGGPHSAPAVGPSRRRHPTSARSESSTATQTEAIASAY